MYLQRLAGVIEAHCAGTTVQDKTMRTLGAVVFKNLVKAKWAPEVRGREPSPCFATERGGVGWDGVCVGMEWGMHLCDQGGSEKNIVLSYRCGTLRWESPALVAS